MAVEARLSASQPVACSPRRFAQGAFDRAHTQWQKETAAMASILEQAIGALQAANTAAGDAERAAAALWS
ncbi:MAG: hypothetical protein BGO91_16245 [Leifsonia sp. 71-9]|nr:MAG: hypothetical protein BGO91_16245 [Leifsonia sp. 71-9]